MKECLRHNLVPFIIEDTKKHFYYQGLSEWNKDRTRLTETCLDGQDTFKRLLDMLGISTGEKTLSFTYTDEKMIAPTYKLTDNHREEHHETMDEIFDVGIVHIECIDVD